MREPSHNQDTAVLCKDHIDIAGKAGGFGLITISGSAIPAVLFKSLRDSQGLGIILARLADEDLGHRALRPFPRNRITSQLDW